MSRTLSGLVLSMKKSYEILRKLRTEFGYTQKDVSIWIGKTLSVYNRKERGILTLSAEEFLLIFATLYKLGPKKPIKVSADKLLLQIISDS